MFFYFGVFSVFLLGDFVELNWMDELGSKRVFTAGSNGRLDCVFVFKRFTVDMKLNLNVFFERLFTLNGIYNFK